MPHRLIVSLLLLFTLLTASASPFLKAKRILFLGDSITYSGGHIALFETYLKLAHPELNPTIMNLGLPSETVSGLSEKGHANDRFPRPHLAERLDRVLKATQPDLIVASYGINCAIYQSFDQNRFRKYREGLIHLRNVATKTGSDIIFLTPWPYDAKLGKDIPVDYNSAVLKQYAQWLTSQRQLGWQVIDVHTALTNTLKEARKKDPSSAFTRDGIHHIATGEWEATKVLLQHLGVRELTTRGAFFSRFPKGTQIYQDTFKTMKTSRDQWLTQTKHLRPGTPGGPDKN